MCFFKNEHKKRVVFTFSLSHSEQWFESVEIRELEGFSST